MPLNRMHLATTSRILRVRTGDGRKPVAVPAYHTCASVPHGTARQVQRGATRRILRALPTGGNRRHNVPHTPTNAPLAGRLALVHHTRLPTGLELDRHRAYGPTAAPAAPRAPRRRCLALVAHGIWARQAQDGGGVSAPCVWGSGRASAACECRVRDNGHRCTCGGGGTPTARGSSTRAPHTRSQHSAPSQCAAQLQQPRLPHQHCSCVHHQLHHHTQDLAAVDLSPVKYQSNLPHRRRTGSVKRCCCTTRRLLLPSPASKTVPVPCSCNTPWGDFALQRSPPRYSLAQAAS